MAATNLNNSSLANSHTANITPAQNWGSGIVYTSSLVNNVTPIYAYGSCSSTATRGPYKKGKYDVLLSVVSTSNGVVTTKHKTNQTLQGKMKMIKHLTDIIEHLELGTTVEIVITKQQ